MRETWSEADRGHPLDLTGSEQVYRENFDRPVGLDGPILWAKAHSDFGKARFDRASGHAYAQPPGMLHLIAYRNNGKARGGIVQSVSAAQAYRGGRGSEPRGFTCAGCYWEARMRFDRAVDTWGAFWLLTPDDPADPGHLEVDVIEYYGLKAKQGHHHALHRWGSRAKERHGKHGNIVRLPELADFGWHRYGVDLRGIARLNSKPAIVFYFDGVEVARTTASADYFTSEFYYLLSLTLRSLTSNTTTPQTMQIDAVVAYK